MRHEVIALALLGRSYQMQTNNSSPFRARQAYRAEIEQLISSEIRLIKMFYSFATTCQRTHASFLYAILIHESTPYSYVDTRYDCANRAKVSSSEFVQTLQPTSRSSPEVLRAVFPQFCSWSCSSCYPAVLLIVLNSTSTCYGSPNPNGDQHGNHFEIRLVPHQ